MLDFVFQVHAQQLMQTHTQKKWVLNFFWPKHAHKNRKFHENEHTNTLNSLNLPQMYTYTNSFVHFCRIQYPYTDQASMDKDFKTSFLLLCSRKYRHVSILKLPCK